MAISTDALDVTYDPRTAADIVADAIALLSARLPEWVPRNASPEVVLLEAMATVAAEITATADVVLGGTVEAVLAGLYQVPRLAGTSAVGTVTITFDTATTTTIPTDTALLLRDYDTELVITSDVEVTAATSVEVPVATVEPTADVNGLGPGQAIDVLDDIPNAIAVDITTALSGGTSPESDDEYLSRARARLARVSSSLVVPDHFSAYVLEDGRAITATTVPAWDGASLATAGSDGGHVTVCCYGRGGQVSAVDQAELAAAMQGITAAGVTVHVVDAALHTVPVTVTVHPLPGWAALDVRTAVENALTTWLSPSTWAWGDPVRVTTLTTIVAAADGVDYVTSISTPAADVVLAVNELAVAGTLAVTVA